MNVLNRIDNYLYDREYKLILKDNSLDIVNYDEIVNFSLSQVIIKINDKVFTIEGSNLIISKMQDNEVLITGKVSGISIN